MALEYIIKHSATPKAELLINWEERDVDQIANTSTLVFSFKYRQTSWNVEGTLKGQIIFFEDNPENPLAREEFSLKFLGYPLAGAAGKNKWRQEYLNGSTGIVHTVTVPHPTNGSGEVSVQINFEDEQFTSQGVISFNDTRVYYLTNIQRDPIQFSLIDFKYQRYGLKMKYEINSSDIQVEPKLLKFTNLPDENMIYWAELEDSTIKELLNKTITITLLNQTYEDASSFQSKNLSRWATATITATLKMKDANGADHDTFYAGFKYKNNITWDGEIIDSERIKWDGEVVGSKKTTVTGGKIIIKNNNFIAIGTNSKGLTVSTSDFTNFVSDYVLPEVSVIKMELDANANLKLKISSKFYQSDLGGNAIYVLLYQPGENSYDKAFPKENLLEKEIDENGFYTIDLKGSQPNKLKLYAQDAITRKEADESEQNPVPSAEPVYRPIIPITLFDPIFDWGETDFAFHVPVSFTASATYKKKQNEQYKTYNLLSDECIERIVAGGITTTDIITNKCYKLSDNLMIAVQNFTVRDILASNQYGATMRYGTITEESIPLYAQSFSEVYSRIITPTDNYVVSVVAAGKQSDQDIISSGEGKLPTDKSAFRYLCYIPVNGAKENSPESLDISFSVIAIGAPAK